MQLEFMDWLAGAELGSVRNRVRDEGNVQTPEQPSVGRGRPQRKVRQDGVDAALGI